MGSTTSVPEDEMMMMSRPARLCSSMSSTALLVDHGIDDLVEGFVDDGLNLLDFPTGDQGGHVVTHAFPSDRDQRPMRERRIARRRF